MPRNKCHWPHFIHQQAEAQQAWLMCLLGQSHLPHLPRQLPAALLGFKSFHLYSFACVLPISNRAFLMTHLVLVLGPAVPLW